MIKWESMHVNTKRALEMEAKTYKYPTHIAMIQEIIANAQDAFNEHNTQNPTLEIFLKRDETEKFIIFHNNAKPIPENFFFKKYSTLFESSKNIGDYIGFVGIGAKIFLPSHKDAEIITITGDKKKLAVRWKWTRDGPEHITSQKNSLSKVVDLDKFPHTNGTTFICRLSNEQYSELKSKIQNIIHFWWNHALITELFTIKIHGEEMTPKFPSNGKRFDKTFSVQGNKIRFTFFISDNELDDDYQNIVYVVQGKRIENDKLETALTVKDNFGKRIFCYVDVTILAKYVIKSKEGFERHRYVSRIKHKIHQIFWKFIKEQDLYKDRTKTITKNVELENLADKLNLALQNLKFKDLNPFLAKKLSETVSAGGGKEPISETDGSQQSGESTDNGGDDNGHVDNPDTGSASDDKGKKSGERKKKFTRGINIIEIEHEGEEKEAYVSISDSALVINTGHPFYKKIEGRLIGEYHKYKIVVEALVLHQAESEGWDAQTVSNKSRELLHSIYD